MRQPMTPELPEEEKRKKGGRATSLATSLQLTWHAVIAGFTSFLMARLLRFETTATLEVGREEEAAPVVETDRRDQTRTYYFCFPCPPEMSTFGSPGPLPTTKPNP